jgi:hypothetical protein
MNWIEELGSRTSEQRALVEQLEEPRLECSCHVFIRVLNKY